MKPRPTSADVAKLAGVSRATVSYILGGRRTECFPKETRDRVFAAAKTLGYRANLVAQSLRSGRGNSIGLVSFRLDSPVSAGILAGAERVLAPLGYRIIVTCSRYDMKTEAEQAMLLLQHQVSGIIVLPCEPIDPDPNGHWAIASAEVPVCMFTMRQEAEWLVDYVGGDDYDALYTLTSHLASLGHKRIAHIRGVMGALGNVARLRGYQAAIRDHGLCESAELIVGDSYEGAGAEDAISSLLALPERPTAITCANDFIAAEAMLVLKRLGVRVPEDMAITGMADVDPARYLGITTTHFDFELAGAQAAEFIVSRMGDPTLPTRAHIQTSGIVCRDTCGCKLLRR